MSAFTGSLVIEEIVPGRRWRLVEPLRYEAGAKGSGILIEVPAGFETDGTTLPAVLRLVLAVWGTYGRAACIHDFLYGLIRCGQQHGHPAFSGLAAWSAGCSDPALARAWADHEFRIAMRACGTRPALAWVMWAAVRQDCPEPDLCRGDGNSALCYPCGTGCAAPNAWTPVHRASLILPA